MNRRAFLGLFIAAPFLPRPVKSKRLFPPKLAFHPLAFQMCTLPLPPKRWLKIGDTIVIKKPARYCK